eukprot:TRINITY_DN13146_c0_g1::TRINITY_DN13146_c0_g1_i1::g.31139::m.31139 TRINITY_DN13146_c0_g1::TRINITY_DN13146_c0_g1_i1::g.31139  ORF type:complete len:261 (-),score=9.02,DUF2834/PF11196.3/0.16,DUF2834/PF11196.3/0.001,DUF2818/PF10993.3/1.9e+03,DUF2818/PF10993.3/0.28,DUF2818/PF10993.3/1.4e+03 TRINITY_DN13146_c0_g1_i1:29-787(-)
MAEIWKSLLFVTAIFAFILTWINNIPYALFVLKPRYPDSNFLEMSIKGFLDVIYVDCYVNPTGTFSLQGALGCFEPISVFMFVEVWRLKTQASVLSKLSEGLVFFAVSCLIAVSVSFPLFVIRYLHLLSKDSKPRNKLIFVSYMVLGAFLQITRLPSSLEFLRNMDLAVVKDELVNSYIIMSLTWDFLFVALGIAIFMAYDLHPQNPMLSLITIPIFTTITFASAGITFSLYLALRELRSSGQPDVHMKKTR